MQALSDYLDLLKLGAICGIVAAVGVVGCLIMLWHVLSRLPPRPPRFYEPPTGRGRPAPPPPPPWADRR